MEVRKLVGDTARARAGDVGQLFGNQWVEEHEVHAIIEAPGVGKRVPRGGHSIVITRLQAVLSITCTPAAPKSVRCARTQLGSKPRL